MGGSAHFSRLAFALITLAALGACDSREEQPVHPVGPQLAAMSAACDFRGAAQEARGYFPGKGKNSTADEAQAVLDLMEEACDAPDDAAYTALFYDVATIVQGVLENGTGGDAESGASLLTRLTTMLGPDEQTFIFDPCGGAADCTAWEGFPAPLDFLSVLTDPDGTWAVLTTGTDAVCSEFRVPCSGVSPAGGDVWGARPSPDSDWPTVFFGRTTLMIGHPIPGPSPTGELLADTEIPAYRFLLIPEPSQFAEGSEVFVGLCSPATPTIDELLVQKGLTVLNQVSIADWCTVGEPAPSLLQRLASFLSPAPAPLTATALASIGPGGRAGSYTDFFVIDASDQAILELQSEPANGTVGQPILGQDGQPLTLRTSTATQELPPSPLSPLENARIRMTVIGNGGLIPSGNGVSDEELSCGGFVCEGSTQADEEPLPGSLVLETLTFTKSGQYSLCFDAFLVPLVFNNPVCTEKFVVTP
jgi:hypothetical protein